MRVGRENAKRNGRGAHEGGLSRSRRRGNEDDAEAEVVASMRGRMRDCRGGSYGPGTPTSNQKSPSGSDPR